MRINKLDFASHDAIKIELNKIFEKLRLDAGLKSKIGTITYDNRGTEATFKVTLNLDSIEQELREAAVQREYFKLFDLKMGDTLREGKHTFKITGFDPSAKYNKLKITRQSDGAIKICDGNFARGAKLS